MDFRTDLAVEQREMVAKHSDNVAVRQYARQNANVTEIEILKRAHIVDIIENLALINICN